MLCAVITGPTYDKAREQILQASLATALEIRLDYFEEVDLEKLFSLCKLPTILTLREYPLKPIEQFAHWIDLDHTCTFFHKMKKGKILCSYHNFEETPEDLEALLQLMKNEKASGYKIATLARSTLDALRMLKFVRDKNREGVHLTGICMGDEGQISRILGPIFGSKIGYAALSLPNAPGQLTLAELCNYYHYPKLSPATAIYGLIGDPITQSPSYITHNHFFRKEGIDAVYVRMRIKEAELGSFFSFAKELGIRGLSVTIPLKEKVAPFLDEIDPVARDMGAVNTIVFEEGRAKGYNTDGLGALDALEIFGQVRGKRVVILGAGGSAKAIAYEAKRRGADLTIVARNKEKAPLFAKKIRSFEEMASLYEEGYDILINCTPEEQPIDPQYLLKKTVYMDINTLHRNTPLILSAKNKECAIVYGYQMFLRQAIFQFNLWFKERSGLTYETSHQSFGSF